MQSQSKKDAFPDLLSIDGKVIASNLATIVSLVDATDGSPVAQAAASGNGQEQKLTTQLIEALPAAALEGKLSAAMPSILTRTWYARSFKNAAAKYSFNSRPIRKPHSKKPHAD